MGRYGELYIATRCGRPTTNYPEGGVQEARSRESDHRCQTGWTGIIARAMHVFATSLGEQFLELGELAAITEVEHTE
jgi:hypothetical protein